MVELMRRAVLLLLCLLMPTLAEATTWYVRPAGGTYGAENGTSYANAFDGFADIVWSGGGIVAGDTLFVCGAHSEKLAAGISGTSVAQTIVDGACPSDAGSITVGGTATAAWEQVDATGESYWTVQHLTLSGGTVASLYCNGFNTNCHGNIYQNNVLTCTETGGVSAGVRLRSGQTSTIAHNTITGNNGACTWGILMDTAESGDATLVGNVIEFNTISDFSIACIRVKGLNLANPLPGPNYVRDNIVHDCGDGIYHVNADGIVNSRNVSYNHTRVNSSGEGYCFASTWADLAIWEYNEGYGCRWKGFEAYADDTRALTGVIVRGNYLHDNDVANTAFRAGIDINNGTPGSAVWTGVSVAGNIIVGSSAGIQVGDGVVGIIANNTIINPLFEAGIFLDTNANNLSFLNNLCATGNTLPCIWMSDAGVGASIIVRNQLYDPTFTTNLLRKASVNYTSGTITTIDAGAVVAAPLLLTNYKTKASSPARYAGVATAFCLDFRGRVCSAPKPDIGAYQATSGDLASTRAARQ
jgi:hypothetical protein